MEVGATIGKGDELGECIRTLGTAEKGGMTALCDRNWRYGYIGTAKKDRE